MGEKLTGNSEEGCTSQILVRLRYPTAMTYGEKWGRPEALWEAEELTKSSLLSAGGPLIGLDSPVEI